MVLTGISVLQESLWEGGICDGIGQGPRAQGSVWGWSAEAASAAPEQEAPGDVNHFNHPGRSVGCEGSARLWTSSFNVAVNSRQLSLIKCGFASYRRSPSAVNLCWCAVHRPFPRGWRGRKLFWVGENPSWILIFFPKRRSSYCCAKQKPVICRSIGNVCLMVTLSCR